MNFETCYNHSKAILMEGAVAERIKHEYKIKINKKIALADLIYNKNTRDALFKIYMEYLHISEKYNIPFIATTPTRLANYIRVKEAGYDEKLIFDNVDFLQCIQKSTQNPMFVGGLMGCKGDAYKTNDVLSIQEAYEFHKWQADLFKKSQVDFFYAGIMPALSESIGMAKAMESTNIPYIISFMIKRNGRLLDGTAISDAIKEVDAATLIKPICYMVNCIHPLVLEEALSHYFNKTMIVRQRFHGIQANTSTLSPEELDNSEKLVTSDKTSLANNMIELSKYIDLKIYGGCCGTDGSHMEALAKRISDKAKNNH